MVISLTGCVSGYVWRDMHAENEIEWLGHACQLNVMSWHDTQSIQVMAFMSFMSGHARMSCHSYPDIYRVKEMTLTEPCHSYHLCHDTRHVVKYLSLMSCHPCISC